MKLMVQMRYFTSYNFITIFILSIGIYYAFVWVCNYLPATNTYATIVEMHKSPIYYLTIGFCVMLCFAIDLFYRSIYFNILTSPSDFLRFVVSKKLNIAEHLKTFDKIYAELKTKYVEEGIKREAELELRREELARAVAFD
jgi:hypothetical protein